MTNQAQNPNDKNKYDLEEKNYKRKMMLSFGF